MTSSSILDRQGRRHVVVLGLLSTFGPISLDLYLPALPDLAAELDASASAAQLSISACLLGLAMGQLLAGPLSDRLGRRRPLLVGLTLYVVTSAACAWAPSIGVLLLLRLLQGFSGAAGLVIARAVARDLYSGRMLVIFFSRLVLVSGMAPVIAPVLGGQLTRVMTWRGIFGVLAAFGVVLLLAGLFGLEETLPPERRTTAGVRGTLRGFRGLLGDRFFVGAALCSGLVGATLFAYIAGSTFVLQEVYGMSSQGFSLVFGSISVSILVMSQVGGRLVRRRSPARVLVLGLGVNLAGATALAVTVLTGQGLTLLVASLLVMVSAVGLVFPTTTALALADYPHQAGSASSLLGLGQYAAGAVTSPLVGIAGAGSSRALGLVALLASASAVVCFLALMLPVLRARRRTKEGGATLEPPLA